MSGAVRGGILCVLEDHHLSDKCAGEYEIDA
jgi:hypothetical protein